MLGRDHRLALTTSSIALFRVSVDEHELRIIEADDTAIVASAPLHRIPIVRTK
jgi:hypothetical protein